MNKYSLTVVRTILSIFVLSLLLVSCKQTEQASQKITNETDLESVIDQMTLEEKISLIHASSPFTSGGVERLGIPELIMSDGPHGVRHEHGRDWEKDEGVRDSSTYLPVGTALAATWNPDLGYKFGTVLGSETNYRGKDIILGPGLNIIRDPLNGRNFEYMTEDPYLNSRMVVGYVKGVQDQGVAACAKHYIANSLEYQRRHVDVRMSERALREIYLPGFKAAVKDAQVLTIMGAYNKFNGTYCCHSGYLLDDILRDELGYEGIVISDWNAVQNTMEAATVGLDIEMGTDLSMHGNINYDKFFLADPLLKQVKKGNVDEGDIDKKVRRILGVMKKIDKFGERKPGAYNTKEHQEIARKIADEAIVLLKNEGILPFDREKVKKLAVIGTNAVHKHAGAGGSSQVKAYYEIPPLVGLQRVVGENTEIKFAQGYQVSREGKVDNSLISEAVQVAKDADAVVFVGGLIHGYSDDWNDNAYDAENHDKPDMMLPFGQDELIQAILKANPKTAIVLISGGPVDMRAWKDDANAIVQMWYNGMEGGNALAAMLYGDINPSGKLPMTFPEKLEDSPAHALSSYPNEDLVIDHKEDIFVGYRYYDSYNVEPAFGFGHGLSYTTFKYSDLKTTKKEGRVMVGLKVANTGEVKGSEVIQVYVKDEESALKRPEKELKAFLKISLKPSESKSIFFELEDDAFSYYDDAQKKWVLEPGRFNILIGSSSRDIRLREVITL